MPAPSYNALLADRAAAHAVDLLRFDVQARAQILGFLRRLQDVLAGRIEAFDLGAQSGSLGRLRLETLLRQVEASIATAYGQMADVHAEILTGVARIESSFALGQFREIALGADLGLNVLSASQLRSLASGVSIEGAPSRGWWEAQAGDLRERFRREVEEGIASGETTDEIVRRIRGRATGRRNTYELNGRTHTYVEFKGGVMDTSTRHARALVRTSVQAVAGDARRSTYEENQDVVKGLVQVSTLDTRTTATCLAYGGKAWSLPDYAPIDHELPYAGGVPRHFNCRSTEAPLLRSWQELGFTNLRDAPRGVRWSRLDGDVPGDLSMESFLGRRSDDQVDEMLGPGVAKLWRSGKVSLEDLIDKQNGRPLTLAEVEARVGVAA